jgi:NADH-quinone oxidoreductase subunit J
MIPILFVACAAILVVSSLLVILHRNPVASALFLVTAFCSLAAIYLLLHAEFIGLVQIVVYAGAIMVLFLFVIMYLNLGHDVDRGVMIALRRGLGWLVGAVLLAEVGLLLARGLRLGPVAPPPDPLTSGVAPGNTQEIGLLLYSRYLFPFEITSLVLLVAMVGVIVIAKGRRAPGPPSGVPRAPAEPAAAPGEEA